MKKRWMYGLLLGASLCALSGCGHSSDEQAKDTTPQSAESSSQEKEKSTDVQSQPCTIETPFNPDKPVYVTEKDDENRNVTAIVAPYLDTKDKVKVEVYDTGDLQKTYIVDYNIKEVRKGKNGTPTIWRYTFYDEDNKKHEFDVGVIKAKDLNDEVFLWSIPLEKEGKDYSDKEISEQLDSNNGDIMSDNENVFTLK